MAYCTRVLLQGIGVILSASILGCGASKVFTLPPGEYSEIPNTRAWGRETRLRTEIVSLPSQGNPTVRLQLREERPFEATRHRRTATDVKLECYYSTEAVLVSWTIGWVIFHPLWEERFCQRHLSKAPSTLRGGPVHPPDSWRVWLEWEPVETDSTFEEERFTGCDTFTIRRGKVVIRTRDQSKSYEVPQSGETDVDVVADLNLRRFEVVSPISCVITHSEVGGSDSVQLDPRQWTLAHVQITTRTRVETEHDSKLLVLGYANPKDEFLLLHQGRDLTKIRFHGKEGYVPNASTKIVWLARSP
jgi:hypothetical protein